MFDNELYSCNEKDTKYEEDKYRYSLGLPGKKMLLTIGLNPSKANKIRSDSTVTRVQKVLEKHDKKYDGFVMLNLYPERNPYFKNLDPEPNLDEFKRNLDRIVEIVKAQKNPEIWAAWGNSVLHHSYFVEARDELFKRLKKYKVTWLRFGELTKKGHPRHPSRLHYSWEFSDYEIK